MGAIPESLYTVDPDDWDFVLSELNAFNAKVMKFCVERDVDPWEDVPVLEELFGYGKAIDVYKAEKEKQVQAFWARFGKGAEKGPEQQADKEEPTTRGKGSGAPRLEERVDVEKKKEAARMYLALRAKGMKAEIAAQLVGHARRTLDSWVRRLGVR
jgi:hypothetical protein